MSEELAIQVGFCCQVRICVSTKGVAKVQLNTLSKASRWVESGLEAPSSEMYKDHLVEPYSSDLGGFRVHTHTLFAIHWRIEHRFIRTGIEVQRRESISLSGLESSQGP